MIAAGIYGADVGRPPRPGDGGWTWLVSVRYAGRVLRWGNAASFAVEHDGELLSVFGDSDLSGLSITDAIPLGSSGSPSRSLSFAVFMPAGVDVALNERRGIPFSGSEVEVALVPDGGTLSDRCVVLRGVVSEPTYGTADEAVSFTAREPEGFRDVSIPARGIETTSALLYDPNTDVFITDDLTRTEEAALESIGKPWPRVFGHPGKLQLVGSNGLPTFITVPGSPAYVVSQEYDVADKITKFFTLLLTYDHVEVDGTINLCRNDPESERGLMTVAVDFAAGTDYRGLPFMFVSDADTAAVPDGFLPDPLVAGQQEMLRTYRDWFVSWAYHDAPPIEGTTSPSAGQVMLWLVKQSAIPWDMGRCEAAAESLAAFRYDGAIEDWTTSVAWLTDHVLRKLPVYLTSGPLGLYPVAIPYLYQYASPIASLTVDESSVFLVPQAVQVEADVEVSEVTVRWARDAQSGGFYKSATRTADGAIRNAGAIGPVPVAGLVAVSDAPAGNTSTSVDLPYVWDDQTAYRILDWLAWREMRQHRTVAVDVDASAFGWLSVGDVVTLTAADLHLDAAVCLVASVTRSTSLLWRLRLMPLDE